MCKLFFSARVCFWESLLVAKVAIIHRKMEKKSGYHPLEGVAKSGYQNMENENL
jgi:hypothetical protein